VEPYVSVIGGINLDIKGIPSGTLRHGTSNPGAVYTSSGGVGRNIAHNLALLGIPVVLFGAVGDDAAGKQLIEELRHIGVNTRYIRVVKTQQTGMYLSLLNEHHDLAIGISGMMITDSVDPDYLSRYAAIIQQSHMVVAETNLRTDVLSNLLILCRQTRTPCLVEPVSIEKGFKILDVTGLWKYMTPNMIELNALSQYPVHGIDDLPMACSRLSQHCRHILVTLGEDGIYSYESVEQTGILYPSCHTHIVDSTGAGDAFVAGFVSGIVRGHTTEESIRIGIVAACSTVQSEYTVNPHLSFEHCVSVAMAM
jgi:pseudouridine kinase